MGTIKNNGKNKKSGELKTHLHESDKRFQILFEQAAVGMAFVTVDGRWLQVNQKLCNILGYTQEELLKHTFKDVTYLEDIGPDLANVERLLASETQTYTLEKRYVRKDESIIWINLTVSLVRDDDTAEPLYFIGVIEDINDRKRMEYEAGAHASQLEAILGTITDAVVVYDSVGNITFASRSALELFPFLTSKDYLTLPIPTRASGYLLRDEYGQSFAQGHLPIDRLLRGDTLKGVDVIEAQMRDQNGRELYISMSGSPMRDAQGQINGAVLLARDVTARRDLERRTQRALEGLLAMAEALVELPKVAEEVVGLRLAALTCSVLDCQRVSIQLIEPETQILRPLAVVGLSPEDEQAWWVTQRQQIASLDESPMPEIVTRLRDNEVIVIDMTEPPMSALPNPYNIQVMLVVPMYIDGRLVGLLNLDYGLLKHKYTQSEIALASAVAKLSVLVIERQRLLQERANARGRELALLEANSRMEEFLGVASHELRTPLTTIKANIQLAQRRLRAVLPQLEDLSPEMLSKIEAVGGLLQRAERQVGVLNRLVGDLIDISRIQTGKLQLQLRPEPYDVLTIIRDAVQEQRNATPNRRINLNLPEERQLRALVDADRIVQVLTNYLNNALKYSLVDAPVDVSVELVDQESVVRILVQDYGIGLAQNEQDRIWERFYQVHDANALSGSAVGLGLGLHISRTIIERHNGHVGVESAPDCGSTFWFTLPLVHGEQETG